MSAVVLPSWMQIYGQDNKIIKKEERQIVLDRPFKLDLLFWDTFMANYNDIILIHDPVFTECDSVLSTDSCLSGMDAVTSKGCHCHIYNVHAPYEIPLIIHLCPEVVVDCASMLSLGPSLAAHIV